MILVFSQNHVHPRSTNHVHDVSTKEINFGGNSMKSLTSNICHRQAAGTSAFGHRVARNLDYQKLSWVDCHPDVISVISGRLFKHARYMIRRHGWWLLYVGVLYTYYLIILGPPYHMSEWDRYTTLSAMSSLFWKKVCWKGHNHIEGNHVLAKHSAKIACDCAFVNLLISAQRILNVVQIRLSNSTILRSSILLNLAAY